MKIKTITCHDVYNVGASLQAYALATYLKTLGHDVEIIDYKPDYLSGHYRLWGGVNAVYDKPVVRQAYCLVKFPGRLARKLGKRKRRFDRFTAQYLPLTERYSSFRKLEQNPPQADVYIAGSDQIWNTLFSNGRDPAFYLQFAPQSSTKASYAASFAAAEIADGWSDKLADWISDLDYVSVREGSGLDILRKLGITRGYQVMDPVFLLDASAWSRFSGQWKNPVRQPYVLLYDFDRSREMADFAGEIARKNGWQLISFLKNPYIKKDFSDEGPIAFVSLICGAKAVVSNSFHATAFSLIFHKEFWVFDREEGINARMRDLMKLVGVEGRIASKKRRNDEIDYDTVQDNIDRVEKISKDYLEMVLERDTNGKDENFYHD